MKYKILTTSVSRWGEGWQFGDIVDIDNDAARVPLQNGEITLYVEEVKNELACPDCGKECKSKVGLVSHLRTHKK
jgi:hypothetical protein